MKINRFEELECWRESKNLVKMVYEATRKNNKFNKDYSLRDQLTRASVSVMSNIAEGFSRQSNKEFVQFLYISKASASEVQSILYIAFDLEYVDKATFEEIYNKADTISKMNSGLIKYLCSQHK